LRHLAENGDTKAASALELVESPNTFLATVQIGITLVGVLAGAFSGATLAQRLALPLGQVNGLAPYAAQISLALVVGSLTYLTLVVGELVPKRLGMAHPEAIARSMAGSMRRLSKIASPIVRLLGASTELLLRLVGVRPGSSAGVTEEEVRLLVKEGMRAGLFHPSEPAMVERVMALDQLPVADLMTPRARIIWINVHDSHDAIWHKIVVSGHSSFPVYEGNRDRVLGLISVKSIYANLAAGAAVKVKDLTTPALVVPDSQTVNALLEKFKQTGKHIALVADEFGSITGLVSLHDVMEAILGELPSLDERIKPRAVRKEDGSWLVDGMLDAEEFERLLPDFKLHPKEERKYQTFAGFVIQELARLPAEGESFQRSGYRVEIIDMDGHRVDKLLLIPIRESKPEGSH
jgi:putative hemolysin